MTKLDQLRAMREAQFAQQAKVKAPVAKLRKAIAAVPAKRRKGKRK